MNSRSIPLILGFVIGVILAAIEFTIYKIDEAFKIYIPYVSCVAFIPFIAGIIINGITYSKSKNGYATFGSIYLSCFMATVVIVLVIVIWSGLSLLIFPEMNDNTINLLQQGIHGKDGLPILEGVLIYFGWGALFSLIAAGIAKAAVSKPIRRT